MGGHPNIWLDFFTAIGLTALIIVVVGAGVFWLSHWLESLPLSDAQRKLAEQERREEVERLWPYIKERLDHEGYGK